MNRIPHFPLVILLSIALLAAFGVGVSGKFQVVDAKGVLAGPFSALLLLSASIAALLLVILLDWKVWQPRRAQRAREFQRWLTVDVLNCSNDFSRSVSEETTKVVTTISGTFRERGISITRVQSYGARGLRWCAKTASKLELIVARQEMPTPPAPANEFSTGDEDFEALYAWQTALPADALPFLKNDACRAAIKRLASLVAQRGKIGKSDIGLSIRGGEITLLQAPAPDLAAGAFRADEALMILHDLSVLAACLEGAPVPGEASAPAVNVKPGDPLSAWLAVGCVGMGAVVGWMGLTWAAAHFAGLGTAMVVFFLPPVLLAFLFMLGNAGGSGRQAELDEFISKESAEIVKRYADLAGLSAKWGALG
jgi:hypothetical protein